MKFAALPIHPARPAKSANAPGVRAGALIASGALIAFGAMVLAACGAAPGIPGRPAVRLGGTRAGDALVRFTSCGDALRSLRAAASKAVGPDGFTDTGLAAAGAPGAPGTRSASSAGPADGQPGAAAPAGPPASAVQDGASQAGAGQAAPGSYSGTNTATPGVDEPDLVKTDGQRIVTVVGGVLHVVDAQTRQLTGVLDLAAWDDLGSTAPASLLLSGSHALVLFDARSPVTAAATPQPPIIGPSLVFVDLSGQTPRVIGTYTIDGALVDARQVGSIARVVVHSAPRVAFPAGYAQSPRQRTAANQAVLASAALSSWLPRYQVTDGAARHAGLVDCAATSHPVAATYSGTSMLTVLTFDLAGDALGDGQPITVVADGDTVYSDGTSLYVANDRQWRVSPATDPAPPGSPASSEPPPSSGPQQYAALYKFDISGPARPVYQASGTVPGWLLGSAGTAQYSLSEWDGALRVATTTGLFGWTDGPVPQSAVYVLEQVGSQLVVIGKVGGLGQGEKIYAVRFAGPVGYVVTYQAVDPLYTLDLSDPAQPRVAGELLLSGYSAYLDPIDATHLIGIGQATDARGHIQGTQVSLFDVSDIAAPTRLAVYRLPFGRSEAEVDPHALLYWPAAGLLVIPEQLPYGLPNRSAARAGRSFQPKDGLSVLPVSVAIVLRVGDHSITRLGTITSPAVPGYPQGSPIRRSLVIGGTLWTLADAGLKASGLATLAPVGWVPFG